MVIGLIMSRVQFIQVIIQLRAQFGINLHECIFQNPSKFNEPAGRVKSEVFETLTSAN